MGATHAATQGWGHGKAGIELLKLVKYTVFFAYMSVTGQVYIQGCGVPKVGGVGEGHGRHAKAGAGPEVKSERDGDDGERMAMMSEMR